MVEQVEKNIEKIFAKELFIFYIFYTQGVSSLGYVDEAIHREVTKGGVQFHLAHALVHHHLHLLHVRILIGYGTVRECEASASYSG